MDYKIILGFLTIGLQVISYGAYFVGIFKGKTKPHAFTWFVWAVINSVVFAAVLLSGGGAGAWVLGMNMLACSVIAIIGLWQKHVSYDKYDWIAMAGALIGIFLWWLTKNPLYAVILVTIADVIGTIPTFRKAYRAPFEENALSFSISAINYPISIAALGSLSLTTVLYPAVITIMDAFLVPLILIRRKKLKGATPSRA
jgi:hypothetical protein